MKRHNFSNPFYHFRRFITPINNFVLICFHFHFYCGPDFVAFHSLTTHVCCHYHLSKSCLWTTLFWWTTQPSMLVQTALWRCHESWRVCCWNVYLQRTAVVITIIINQTQIFSNYNETVWFPKNDGMFLTFIFLLMELHG